MPGVEEWFAFIDLSGFLGNSYDLFGCLFGVRNYAQFRPIAPFRGLPTDVSQRVRHELEQRELDPTDLYDEAEVGAYGYSWISWAEIKAIDWNEAGEAADTRLHRYRRAEDGSPLHEGQQRWWPEFARRITPDDTWGLEATFNPKVWPVGQEWEIEGALYRAEKTQRMVCLDWSVRRLFAVLAALAEFHGDEGVRMVVWFAD